MRRAIFALKEKIISGIMPVLLVFLMGIGFQVHAQKINVHGVVTSSEDGLPLPGVTVIIKGSSGGTVTNFDGKYFIKVDKKKELQFSFIGMDPKTVVVNSEVIDIKLSPSSVDLEEVIAIGYGTVKKKELTGAVARVKAEDLTRTITSDVGTALQGQVAGVNIIASSGEPGATSEILIRGISSINGSNTPLFVVDGVPQEGDPGLSTNEIETIDILKDAASCSIYGTRGAAGVILITTKQGVAGSMRVSASGSYGVQSINSDQDLMNASEQTYFDLVQQRMLTNGSTPDDVIVLPIVKQPYSYQNDTNLDHLVYVDNASVQNYNLNISGGSKDIAYNVVAGYYEKEGSIVNSNFQRFNTRANTTYKHEKWNINASVGITQEATSKSPGGIVTRSLKYRPTQSDLDLDNKDPLETIGGDEGTRLSSVLESFSSEDNSTRTKAYANFNLNYEIVKGLKLGTRLGVNFTNDYGHKFSPFQEIYDIWGKEVSDISKSYVQMTSGKSTALTWDTSLNFQKKIDDHKITAFAAFSLEEYTKNSFVAKKYGVSNNDIDVLNGATMNPSATSGSNYTNHLIGTIGRLMYDYKSKYLFSVSARYDGSSKFQKDAWGLFPSASAAWNISDEAFWEPIEGVVNNMKLRGSWGTTGNQNFTPYSYSTTITQGLDGNFGDGIENGSTQTGFANANVKWETTVQKNIGLDLAFFKNKLTLSAEYYQADKEDMLFPVELPGSAGGGSGSKVILNVGNMTNNGFELAMGYRTKTGKVNWNFNSSFSTNANEITEIYGLDGFMYTDDSGLISGAKVQSQVTVLAEGYEAGSFFLYSTDGIVNTEQRLAEYQKLDPNARMGDLIYKDTDGNGKITDDDREYRGSGLPEYEVGFNMTADYKGFDFSMQWYAALGHEIMNGTKATAYGYGRHRDLVGMWSDSNVDSPIPTYRGDTKKHANYRGYTDLWLEDGSYLRLKGITLGYSIPKVLIEKMGMSKFRVYFTAQNPLTITGYSGFDPEIGGGIKSRGLDKGNYPVTSQYIFGLNLNF